MTTERYIHIYIYMSRSFFFKFVHLFIYFWAWILSCISLSNFDPKLKKKKVFEYWFLSFTGCFHLHDRLNTISLFPFIIPYDFILNWSHPCKWVDFRRNWKSCSLDEEGYCIRLIQIPRYLLVQVVNTRIKDGFHETHALSAWNICVQQSSYLLALYLVKLSKYRIC